MTDNTIHLSELVTDPAPILKPGMDYQDGIIYFTIPAKRRVIVPPKRKGQEATETQQWDTLVVTSDGDRFWYDEKNLENHGFSPAEQLFQETEPRWPVKECYAWVLDHKGEVPTSKALFDELHEVYTTYVEFADEAYFTIMPLFIMYSYVFRLWEATGYLHFNGTQASGKSRNLSIINALAFNTVWASSMSAAALYRKLAGSPGTTCLDETEGFDGERGEELRRILNAGYRDGSKATRTEKGAGDRFMPVQYDVYGPKAMASINALDNVIGSRCLIVAMRPALRELPDFLQKDRRWPLLRHKLYLWALANGDNLAACVAAWQQDKKALKAPRLIGRQWEISQQYITLADYIGGDAMTEPLITFFNNYFASQQAGLDATDRLRLTLRCLPRVIQTKTPWSQTYYTVKDIHEVIASYLEDDAAEYFKSRHVTKNLDVLGFRTKKRASGGLQIELPEAAVRREFEQRRVQPFPEDEAWLRGEQSYQSTHIADAPSSRPASVWDIAADDFDLESLTA